MKMTAPMEVGLCCNDLTALSGFYTGVLGFEQVSVIAVAAGKAVQAGLSTDGYRVARLQTPWGERIKLLQPDRAPDPRQATARILDRAGTAYLTFIVDDLQSVLERITAAGVKLLSGTAKVEVRPGVFLAFAEDPEGNILEFVQYADVTAYRPDLAGGED